MSDSAQATIAVLLDRYGTTYPQELGIRLDENTPAPLFQWLTAALLFSARIGADQALQAARGLFAEGLTTAHKMAEAPWRTRVTVLNRNGYARYDESTARMLGETAQMVLDEYGGDLRKLRAAADSDITELSRRLRAFKGIGAVGAGIFLREIQGPWTEIYPFVDDKALAAAKTLKLGANAHALAGLVPQAQFPTLLTALVRAALARDLSTIADASA